ncbi:NACHT domain family [Coleofasciculus chthonoplastes PCC 7420]|uniref:NACHT domain family n=1 Tax=Coleofasciculus chthonoplastes PCC 7420 TaxID=118168 RepID=B4VVB9_9CYAN|nr:NACHT domain-containing protein [Coleofasciculus chthonoplastes]EDX74096.1 NACHT domain family [Coleofasciculus chthonoplastes PCC 7420]
MRSRLHDDIQSLHGTMPLWGVDRWVPLGELFVDVNILEELSSSRRSELDDLWQNFSHNPSYRSLDRIGLGKERQRVSGLEVLARNTNLMVVGKPGSGKTTYLQRVVTECNAGNLQAHRIPVLIKLREFVEDGREVAYSLERYLERCWRLSDAETQLVLDRGRALVLLDGLDEVTGEDGKNITKQIKRFARAYPQVQVIVTCRTQSQESRFERFDYVEVADFNEPQVRAFAEHWFKTVMGDESAGLARAREFLGLLFLEANKPIRELAITPILLSLTCAVFHQTGKFYSKRSKLYEEGLELLLEQWDKSREIERDEIYRDLSVERKLELLSYLAVKKFEQPQYVLFEQAEIEGYIAEFLGIGQRDSRVVLRAIESQHGLLIERSQKVWSFSHLTFQEYLTAKWFVDHAHWQSLANYITDNRWREIFLLVAVMVRDANELLLSMKIKAYEIIALHDKLQQFFNWIVSKYFSIKINNLSLNEFEKKVYGLNECLCLIISYGFSDQLAIKNSLFLNFIDINTRHINNFKLNRIKKLFIDSQKNEFNLSDIDLSESIILSKIDSSEPIIASFKKLKLFGLALVFLGFQFIIANGEQQKMDSIKGEIEPIKKEIKKKLNDLETNKDDFTSIKLYINANYLILSCLLISVIGIEIDRYWVEVGQLLTHLDYH